MGGGGQRLPDETKALSFNLLLPAGKAGFRILGILVFSREGQKLIFIFKIGRAHV